MIAKDLRKSLTIFPREASHREALQHALENARIRLLVISGAFILVFCAVVFRLVSLSVFHDYSDIQQGLSAPTGLMYGRMNVVDREGLVLATTLTTSSLYGDPRVILDAKEAAQKLHKVLPDIPEKEFYKKLTSKRSFVWLARHLTPHQKSQIIQQGIPGVDFRRDQKRVYPYGPLFAHVVGLTDIDGNGIAGIEKSFDQELRQEGQDLKLSVEVRLQHLLRDEVMKGMKEFRAKAAAGVIMDAKTGEILALVSLPDFNPNLFSAKDQKHMFNKATLGVYEMGSTMKVINTAMALDNRLVSLRSEFDASKPLKVGRFTVTDYRGQNRVLNVREIFRYSSNIGSAKMALLAGAERQQKFMRKLGLFDKINLEISETGTPQYPKNWRDANTITASYGYGMSMTPLHLIRAIGGIVSDGKMVQPTLLKRKKEDVEITQVIAPSVSKKMRELMHLVIEEGSGKKANIPGFYVMGKTGTVNLRKAHGRGYQTKKVRTSFVAAFPKKPKYVVWVMLEDPKGLKKTFGFNAAGWNSAAIAGNVIERMTTLLGMVPEVSELN